MTRLSAYVPCFNNERTVGSTVAALRRQTIPIDDIVVVDDGSTDRSVQAAADAGARVVSLGQNRGRGAANRRGIEEARHDLVVCCGATNVLPPEFAKHALQWFEDPQLAAVYARVCDPQPSGAVQRWRARHLFRMDIAAAVAHHAPLITTGSMLRRPAVCAVGGFDPTLRYAEDAELGVRLLEAGFDVVSDPSLQVHSIVHNTLSEVLERYWRWNAGVEERLVWAHYPKLVAYSLTVLARADLAAGDPAAVPISLIAPHYQVWRTAARQLLRRHQHRAQVQR